MFEALPSIDNSYNRKHVILFTCTPKGGGRDFGSPGEAHEDTTFNIVVSSHLEAFLEAFSSIV